MRPQKCSQACEATLVESCLLSELRRAECPAVSASLSKQGLLEARRRAIDGQRLTNVTKLVETLVQMPMDFPTSKSSAANITLFSVLHCGLQQDNDSRRYTEDVLPYNHWQCVVAGHWIVRIQNPLS